MGRWTYFTDAEVAGLVDDICFKLDRARELFGYEIEITCGFRTPSHNAEIGGAQDSEHIFGRAADLKPPADSVMRERMVWALCTAGFKRVESCPHHFHVDISLTKPSPCFWQGTDR